MANELVSDKTTKTLASVGDEGANNGKLFYMDTTTNVTGYVNPVAQWSAKARALAKMTTTIQNQVNAINTCNSAWDSCRTTLSATGWTASTGIVPMWWAMGLDQFIGTYTPVAPFYPVFDCSICPTCSEFNLPTIPIKIADGAVCFRNPAFGYSIPAADSTPFTRNLEGFTSAATGMAGFTPNFNVSFTSAQSTPIAAHNVAGTGTPATTLSNTTEVAVYGTVCANGPKYTSTHFDPYATGLWNKGIWPWVSLSANPGPLTPTIWVERALNATELAFLNNTSRHFFISCSLASAAHLSVQGGIGFAYCEGIRLKLHFQGVNS